ncbi:MAG TPA: MdtA/MuxA family multidrug efflux RND transporter periplasmic adaptor subunit [Alphaproteobacteria bacterium]
MDDLNFQWNLRDQSVGQPVRPRRSLWRRIGWIAFAVLLVGGVAWWIHSRPAQQAPRGRFASEGPMSVVAAPVEQGSVNITLNALGTVTPLATVTVRTQINGQLTRIYFQEGQQVQKGDPLAEIDTRPYDLALEQLQGQLARDQALLKNAQVDVARYRKLLAEDSIAEQQLATQEALVRQLEGTVKTDQAMVDNAKLNLVYCRIVSPISGRVGLRLVDPGNYVQVNDASGLVVVTEVQPITVIFTLPEDNVPALMKRLRSGAELQVSAFNRNQTVKLATGKLLTVDNQIDPTTGTVKLRALFDNVDESLFPNQFVNVQLLLDVLQNATVIPAAAVQRGAPGTFVYVIKPDDTVTVQPVKLGPVDGERVAVQSGLSPGEQIVVDGADKLRDGAKVALRDTSGAAAPASAPAPGANPPGQGRRPRGGP